MTSTTKPTVIEALSAVMADVQAVKKGDRNTQQNYPFRGIDAVINAVGPVLRKHGVVAVPAGVEAHYRDVQTSQGKPSRECTVKVTYRFYGPAGDFIDCEVPGESMDFGDKGAPKAMSVAYRIALLQALCIPTDEPDADAQSYERERQVDNPPPDELSLARAELLQTAREKGMGSDPATIGQHFQEVIGKPVPQANLEEVKRFIGWLREDWAKSQNGQHAAEAAAS